MTRKHFQSIAEDIKYQVERIEARRTRFMPISDDEADGQRLVLISLVADLCATFRTINPNFNSAKFQQAAGF